MTDIFERVLAPASDGQRSRSSAPSDCHKNKQFISSLSGVVFSLRNEDNAISPIADFKQDTEK